MRLFYASPAGDTPARDFPQQKLISHSGRGVFSTKTWERLARDTEPAYPEHGRGLGIGPIDGTSIDVMEKNYDTDELHVTTPNGRLRLDYDSGTITISLIEE